MTRPLSKGAISDFICKGEIPPSGKNTFQVIGTKKIQNQENGNYVKVRVGFSDGVYRFTQAVLLVDNDEEIPPNFSIIRINSNSPKNSLKLVNEKLIFVIGDFNVVQLTDERYVS